MQLLPRHDIAQNIRQVPGEGCRCDHSASTVITRTAFLDKMQVYVRRASFSDAPTTTAVRHRTFPRAPRPGRDRTGTQGLAPVSDAAPSPKPNQRPSLETPPGPRPAAGPAHLRRVSPAELPASRACAAAGPAPAAERNGHVTSPNHRQPPGPAPLPPPGPGRSPRSAARNSPRAANIPAATRTGKGTDRKRKAAPPSRFPRGAATRAAARGRFRVGVRKRRVPGGAWRRVRGAEPLLGHPGAAGGSGAAA